jgi:recombination protein RecR
MDSALPVIKLMEQFAKLPGVGRKTAQRFAFYMLDLPEEGARAFAQAILDAREKVKKCPVCGNFTDGERCPICASQRRETETVCVVETPQDILAFERTREYRGVYHVLHGLISPLEGVGPEQLTVKELLARVGEGGVTEVIMATNPTVEGEATAMYIARLIKPLGVKVTRLAYGIPVGGSLEYADEVTLYRALEGRREL